MRAIPLLLLLTLGSAEQSYGPYARPERGGTHSVRAVRDRVLLTWSEQNETGHARVHVVLVNSAGAPISPIRVLPALTASRDALAPAAGTDGAGFLVVWEEVLGMQQSVAMALGPNLEPLGTPHSLGVDTPILTNDYESARVSWHNGSYAVYTGTKNSWRVTANGALLGPITGTPPMAVASDGTVGSVTSTWVFASPWGFQFSTWWFRFTGEAGAATWTEATQAGADVSAPLLVPAGTRFMILWTTPNRVFYRLTAESQTQNFPAAVDTRSRARASCGETHCVVVYATRDANIEGFVFDHTRRDPAVPFVAAASARIELEPQVAVITGSRALVTWRSLGPDGEKLVMRPLQLGPVKQRAVR